MNVCLFPMGLHKASDISSTGSLPKLTPKLDVRLGLSTGEPYQTSSTSSKRTLGKKASCYQKNVQEG